MLPYVHCPKQDQIRHHCRVLAILRVGYEDYAALAQRVVAQSAPVLPRVHYDIASEPHHIVHSPAVALKVVEECEQGRPAEASVGEYQRLNLCGQDAPQACE